MSNIMPLDFVELYDIFNKIDFNNFKYDEKNEIIYGVRSAEGISIYPLNSKNYKNEEVLEFLRKIGFGDSIWYGDIEIVKLQFKYKTITNTFDLLYDTFNCIYTSIPKEIINNYTAKADSFSIGICEILNKNSSHPFYIRDYFE